MSLWSRLANVFRTEHLNRELDEELQAHIEDAIEEGRDPEEVRKAFGSFLRHREQSRDLKVAGRNGDAGRSASGDRFDHSVISDTRHNSGNLESIPPKCCAPNRPDGAVG